MPLYEYECGKCSHRFERIQKYSDPLVKKCPRCKTGRVRKLLSAPAVQFKGSGWYVTDYGRKHSSDGSSSREKESKRQESKESSRQESSAKESSGKESSGKGSSGGDSSPAGGPKKDRGRKG